MNQLNFASTLGCPSDKKKGLLSQLTPRLQRKKTLQGFDAMSLIGSKPRIHLFNSVKKKKLDTGAEKKTNIKKTLAVVTKPMLLY